MTCSVYWIRHPDHTDMFTQGYKRIFLGNFTTKELVNLTIEAYRKENNCG